MRGPAQQPGEVLDRGVVAVHRIRDVHPHAAVQVMADLHRRRRLRCHPVPEDAQIISRIQILGQFQITDLATRSMVREAM